MLWGTFEAASTKIINANNFITSIIEILFDSEAQVGVAVLIKQVQEW